MPKAKPDAIATTPTDRAMNALCWISIMGTPGTPRIADQISLVIYHIGCASASVLIDRASISFSSEERDKS
jgi:hypothetical protein